MGLFYVFHNLKKIHGIQQFLRVGCIEAIIKKVTYDIANNKIWRLLDESWMIFSRE
jgi:hypothetical protein